MCAGEKRWMSAMEGQPGLRRGGQPVAGSKRKFLGLLRNEVRCEDRLLGKGKIRSLRVCLRLNPASTRKRLIQADVTSVFFQ